MSFEPITPIEKPVEEYQPINDNLNKQTKIAYLVSSLVLVAVIVWSIAMI